VTRIRERMYGGRELVARSTRGGGEADHYEMRNVVTGAFRWGVAAELASTGHCVRGVLSPRRTRL